MRWTTLLPTALLAASAAFHVPSDSATAALASRRETTPQASPRKTELRPVGLRELETLAGRVREDLQVKVTWCGEQTKLVPTLVLGSYGHRLDVEKYAGLARPGWHHGNDASDLVVYVQVEAAVFRRFAKALLEAGLEERSNPPAEAAARREAAQELVFARSGSRGRELRYASFVGRADARAALAVLREALGEGHPERERILGALDMHAGL